METSTLTIIVSVVALAIAAYAIYRAHQAGTVITGELLQGTLEESTGTAQELTEAGLAGARAAQQLFESGKITRDKRLDKAFAYVRQFFPDLDQERIIMAIEAGVFVVNSAVAAIPDKRTTGFGSTPGDTTAPDKPLILAR